MNGDADRIDAFYRHFLDRFLHGLKNRLTPANTASYMLAEGAPRSTDVLQTLGATVVTSLEGSRDMLTAVQRLLDVRPGKLEDVDPIAFFRERAETFGIAAKFSGRPADRRSIDTGLWSIIADEIFSNVKHHADASAWVSVTPVGENLRFECRSKGGGLKMLPERALEATRKREGHAGQGFGLSCAMLAATLLEGDLVIDEQDGEVIVTVQARCARP